MPFERASAAEKLGICIPVVGLVFWFYRKHLFGFCNLTLIDYVYPIIKGNSSCDMDEQQAIINEYRQISGALMVQGMLCVIGSVALAALGGIIATCSAVALGTYGSWLVFSGGYDMYETIGYPQQKAAPT